MNIFDWISIAKPNEILMLLLILSIAFSGFFVFIKFIITQKKNINIKTPIGSFSTGNEEEKKEPQKQEININIDRKKPVGYISPSGLPGFMEHRVFKLLDKIISGKYVELQNKGIQSELKDIKKAAFSHLMVNCVFVSFDEMLQAYVNDCLNNGSDARIIVATISERVIASIKKYEYYASIAQIKLSENRILLNIPPIMTNAFRNWNQSVFEILHDKLDIIIESQFYPSWQSKLIAILDTFDIIFSLVINHSECSLVGLNGELDAALNKNIVYKSKY